MKKLKIITLLILAMLTAVSLIRSYFFSYIEEENWWLKNIFSARVFFDAIWMGLFGVLALVVLYFIYRLIRFIFSTKLNLIIASSIFVLLASSGYYYSNYYKPTQDANRIFKANISMKLVDENAFDDSDDGNIIIKQYEINTASQQLLLAKDSTAWTTSQKWVFEPNIGDFNQSKIVWNTAQNDISMLYLKEKVLEDLSSALYSKNENGKPLSAETIANSDKLCHLVLKNFKDKNTLYLCDSLSQDYGFLIDYTLYFLSSNRKDLWSIKKQSPFGLFSH